tara:strand:+ start:308 stop:649 length:342 start_codon:yes stop_codon:yes gene_type:complete
MNIAAFLIGCIGIRLLLSFLVKISPVNYLPFYSVITFLQGLAFIFIYLFNLRKYGMEAGGKIWWNKLRPVHGVMYLLFSIYSYKKEVFAWKILFVDAVLGLIFWLNHHYLNIV